MEKKLYRICAVWQMHGSAIIEASSLEEAKDIALADDFGLYEFDASYLSDSFEIDHEGCYEI